MRCVEGDSRHINEIFDVIKEADVVVHLAEMVGDPLCEQRPEKTFAINYLASVNIATICKNLGIQKFIYISSCSVYGSNTSPKLLDENSIINPLSIYAKLKSICEKAIISNYSSLYKPCILRLGTVFGLSLRPRYDLVINLFSGLVANKKKIFILVPKASIAAHWRGLLFFIKIAFMVILTAPSQVSPMPIIHF